VEQLPARIEGDRRIAAAVLGGVAILLLELRYEHREVLGETWRSWVPLLYATITLVAGALALLRWRAGGRRVLAVLFIAGIAVGLVGFWFHTDGHLFSGFRDVLLAWRIPPGQNGGIRMGSRPPPLAPLAFCGLGAIGLFACAIPGARGPTS
jgi:hypothetical protein